MTPTASFRGDVYSRPARARAVRGVLKPFVLLGMVGMMVGCGGGGGAPLAEPVASNPCSSPATLGVLVTCISDQIPRAETGGFVVPTVNEQQDFRSVVASMLSGECDFELPASLRDTMQVQTFVDAENDKGYCVLKETTDADGDGFVDKGWGTFIVDAAATIELSHQAPHPIADKGTEMQAVDIFKGTNSRSYLMCGAHRNANATASSCQSDYQEADCAHAVQTMYHAAVEELTVHYGSTNHAQIQWHGMIDTTCPSVSAYISEGLAAMPDLGSKAIELQETIMAENPSWNVDVPGDGTCSLNATSNVQGRLLNGVVSSAVCIQEADSALHKFIHIEQQATMRQADNWVDAIRETFPTLPAPVTNLTATAGLTSVSLIWDASPKADSYSLYRSESSGGPYTILASEMASTTYTDVDVHPGLIYFYAVAAVNWAGESDLSKEVSVTLPW